MNSPSSSDHSSVATAAPADDTAPLSGKIALVTGGSRNIGRDAALALASLGADVVVTYVTNDDLADAVVADIESTGRRAAAIGVDLTGTDGLADFEESFRAIVGDWGHDGFDILVNNAGTLRIGMFDAVSEDDLDAVYATNYKSVFFLTQRLGPLLRDGGRIINLGSGTAGIAFGPLVSYGPLKAALQSLTKYLAGHFGPRNIAVNAVAPGGLDDDFNAELFDHILPAARDVLRSNTALGRIGMPHDIGGVIAFLAGPAASFISGATIPVDGGYHL